MEIQAHLRLQELELKNRNLNEEIERLRKKLKDCKCKEERPDSSHYYNTGNLKSNGEMMKTKERLDYS